MLARGLSVVYTGVLGSFIVCGGVNNEDRAMVNVVGSS